MKVADTLAVLKREELQSVLEKSDMAGFLTLSFNLLLIFGCFALVFALPTWWAWIFASCVLAGRQLGMAILMHDCAHGALFKSSWPNRFFGQWICAAPVFADLDRYRSYHLEHHRTAGSERDPDRPNYMGYPVSAASFRRKLLRDITGLTGVRLTLMLLKMNAGLVKYQLSYDSSKKTQRPSMREIVRNLLTGLFPTVLTHGVLLALCWSAGRAELYLLWWLAWMTWYMLFSRIRNAAEHGATIDINDLDPMKNTRTTLANPLERLTVAPNFVNYHLEHHLLPTVPPHQLRRFHQLLSARGALAGSKIAHGYGEVISDLVRSRSA